MVIFAGIR